MLRHNIRLLPSAAHCLFSPLSAGRGPRVAFRQMAAAQAERAATGFYCSTSGTYFTDKEALAEHYKSDFHRYNLKRKVAGLPPVTREWFEARKAQLVSTAAATGTAPVTKIWMDPLTKKKFMTENTYNTFVTSKKYLDLVRKSGAPAPEPVIIMKKEQERQEREFERAARNIFAYEVNLFQCIPSPLRVWTVCLSGSRSHAPKGVWRVLLVH